MTRIDEILAAERPGFARAVKALIAGDARALRAELSPEPELVWARSSSAHRATLLHYTAANGIESELQCEVPNADEIARMLLVAGAEPDALCDAYDGKCPTTLNLLASSDHPNEAGVAGRLTVVLVPMAPLWMALMATALRSPPHSISPILIVWMHC